MGTTIQLLLLDLKCFNISSLTPLTHLVILDISQRFQSTHAYPLKPVSISFIVRCWSVTNQNNLPVFWRNCLRYTKNIEIISMNSACF